MNSKVDYPRHGAGAVGRHLQRCGLVHGPELVTENQLAALVGIHQIIRGELMIEGSPQQRREQHQTQQRRPPRPAIGGTAQGVEAGQGGGQRYHKAVGPRQRRERQHKYEQSPIAAPPALYLGERPERQRYQADKQRLSEQKNVELLNVWPTDIEQGSQRGRATAPVRQPPRAPVDGPRGQRRNGHLARHDAPPAQPQPEPQALEQRVEDVAQVVAGLEVAALGNVGRVGQVAGAVVGRMGPVKLAQKHQLHQHPQPRQQHPVVGPQALGQPANRVRNAHQATKLVCCPPQRRAPTCVLYGL